MFDYIRDHLGYRIELQQLQTPSELRIGKENLLNLDLINRGFATVFSGNSAYYVLTDAAGKVWEFPTTAKPVDWQPYEPQDSTYTPLVHSIGLSLNLPTSLTPGEYKLGVWMPDGSERLKYDARYAIRCANGNTEWWTSKDNKYGINVLTTIVVK